MLDTPWVTLRRIFKKNNTHTKKTVKYVFELSDKFSLWIVGISLASISLLLSNLSGIGSYIPLYYYRLVLIFLFLSVFFGVIYRIVFIFYYIYLDKAFTVIDYSLSDDEYRDIETRLNGNESFEDLIELNNQFRDTDGFLESYRKATDLDRTKMYDNLVSLYLNDVDITKKSFDYTFSMIIDLYNKHLGIRKKSFYKEPSIIGLNFTKYTSIILYFAFILSFLLAVAFFVFTITIHK